MSRLFFVCLFVLLTVLGVSNLIGQRPLKVLVFAEEYRYGRAAFELAEMFASRQDLGITADFANTENILEPESLAPYDVLVLFNHNDITTVHEKNITSFVASGKGLLALHHVVSKLNNNPELTRLVGGYYDMNEDGFVEHRDYYIMPIQGKEHPILEGAPARIKIKNDQDFRMRFYPGQEVDRFLTCDITDNGEQNDCGWTRTEGAGRVAFLSPGDPVEEKPFIVSEPLSRLIVNAVLWVSGR